jgi:hypothetical protein
MELLAKIRRDARVEGWSIRGLAKRYQVGRDTVRQALSNPVPPARKQPERNSPRLDPFKHVIDAMLVEDTTAPRKQRHTARRVLTRLIEEHGAEELSYSTFRDDVRVRRAQIDVEAGSREQAIRRIRTGIRAAQLRVALDEARGRQTQEAVVRLAQLRMPPLPSPFDTLRSPEGKVRTDRASRRELARYLRGRVRAARLRIALGEGRGRPTPEAVKRLAQRKLPTLG